MAEPELVADCLKAMQDAVSIPVTVKHRIGIDRIEGYDYLRDFVATVATRSDCRVFVVHARNAILKGLSPKENREIPPLKKPTHVHRLKQEFAELEIVINGGFARWSDIEAQLGPGRRRDGRPRGLSQPVDPGGGRPALFGDDHPLPTRAGIIAGLMPFVEAEVADGLALKRRTPPAGSLSRVSGARNWRRMLSDHTLLGHNDPACCCARSMVERTMRRGLTTKPIAAMRLAYSGDRIRFPP